MIKYAYLVLAFLITTTGVAQTTDPNVGLGLSENQIGALCARSVSNGMYKDLTSLEIGMRVTAKLPYQPYDSCTDCDVLSDKWNKVFSKIICEPDNNFSIWSLSLLQRAILWDQELFVRRLFCGDVYSVDVNANIARPGLDPYTILDWVNLYLSRPDENGGSSVLHRAKSIKENVLLPCGAKRWKDLTPEEQEEMRNGN